MGAEKIWKLKLEFTEDDQRTDCRAVLHIDDTELQGWGRARRNPTDPQVPQIGEEIAAARALSELAHKLLEVSAEAIENFEHRPVRLYA